MSIVVAAWMLDRAACVGMQIGAPHVAASALLDLHHLLIERGFRASSSDDRRIVREEQNARHAKIDCAPVGAEGSPAASSASRSVLFPFKA